MRGTRGDGVVLGPVHALAPLARLPGPGRRGDLPGLGRVRLEGGLHVVEQGELLGPDLLGPRAVGAGVGEHEHGDDLVELGAPARERGLQGGDLELEGGVVGLQAAVLGGEPLVVAGEDVGLRGRGERGLQLGDALLKCCGNRFLHAYIIPSRGRIVALTCGLSVR